MTVGKNRGLQVVAFGCGTGLPVLLRGLKDRVGDLRACLVRVRVRPFCMLSGCARPSNAEKLAPRRPTGCSMSLREADFSSSGANPIPYQTRSERHP